MCLKYFLALADTNGRLNTAVGNKSPYVHFKILKALFYWYVLVSFSMFKIFLEGRIIKSSFFKNLAYADTTRLFSGF